MEFDQESVTIRRTDPDEAEIVHQCNKRNLPIYYTTSEYQQMASDPSYILLGLFNESNTLFGYLLGKQHSDRVFHLNSFSIDQEYRRKRMGTRIMEKMEDEVVKNFPETRFLRLNVDPANQTGIKFYSKVGFGYVCTLPHYYGIGHDGYVLGKRIKR